MNDKLSELINRSVERKRKVIYRLIELGQFIIKVLIHLESRQSVPTTVSVGDGVGT